MLHLSTVDEVKDSELCTGDPGQAPLIADCGNVPEPEQGFLLVTEHNAEINAGFR